MKHALGLVKDVFGQEEYAKYLFAKTSKLVIHVKEYIQKIIKQWKFANGHPMINAQQHHLWMS